MNTAIQKTYHRFCFMISVALLTSLCGSIALAANPDQLHLNQQLTQATESGNLLGMFRLLKLGANPNWQGTDAYHDPLLLVAAMKGQARAVKLLLIFGANPNVKDSRGTPIVVSAATFVTRDPHRSLAMLQSIQMMLFRGHANPNATDSAYIGDDRSALHLAAESGSLELMKLLLIAGANPNQPNRHGETPLYFAAQSGQLEAAKLLLSRGADVNLRSKFTATSPLLAASEGGHSQLVALLIANKANLHVTDAFGKSPIDLARGQTLHILETAAAAPITDSTIARN